MDRSIHQSRVSCHTGLILTRKLGVEKERIRLPCWRTKKQPIYFYKSWVTVSLVATRNTKGLWWCVAIASQHGARIWYQRFILSATAHAMTNLVANPVKQHPTASLVQLDQLLQPQCLEPTGWV